MCKERSPCILYYNIHKGASFYAPFKHIQACFDMGHTVGIYKGLTSVSILGLFSSLIITGIPLVPAFPGQSSFMSFKESCPGILHVQFRAPNLLGFSSSTNITFGQCTQAFWISHSGSSRSNSHQQSLTWRNKEGEEDMYITDYKFGLRLWIMGNKYVKKIGKWTDCLIIIFIIIIISFLHLYVIILSELSCCSNINKWLYFSHCVTG